MILRPLQAATCFRFHTPRWAGSPLSGAGAARHGGRFNAPGVEALYLSAEVATAQAEYQQDDSLMPPGTLVTYRVKLAKIADLSAGFDPQCWSSEWAQWNCDWRALALAGAVPPSWALGEAVRSAGAAGLLFPSLRQASVSGLNLVVFVADLQAGDELSFHDPRGALEALR